MYDIYNPKAKFELSVVNKNELEIMPKKQKKNYYESPDIKYFSSAQIKTLIENTDKLFHRMILRLLFESGGRITEVLSIKYKDIDFNACKITMITLKRRSKKIDRVVPVSDKLLKEISQYALKLGLKNNDYIVSRNGKKHILCQAVNHMIKKQVVKTLGPDFLPLAHPHTFRHSRAIFLLDNGINLSTIKRFLGHVNIANSLIYLQYSTKDYCESFDKVNKIFESIQTN